MTPQSNDDSEHQAEIERMEDEVKRLRRDADLLDDPETIFSFGQMTYDGDGVQQDLVEAANWYRIAAQRGHAGAQHNLAVMYENGEGVSQNHTEAAKWYRLAAEQGKVGSQNNLGCLYESGSGVLQDYPTALEWYRKGAEGGDTNARSNYARLRARMELDHYQTIVNSFVDLVANRTPLIGDCTLLPHPKGTILYAIKFLEKDHRAKREAATDAKLVALYDGIIPTLNHLFTHLARDWHDIDAKDKDVVTRLAGHDSFPDWAVPLKEKYINQHRAWNEADDITDQVIKDMIVRQRELEC